MTVEEMQLKLAELNESLVQEKLKNEQYEKELSKTKAELKSVTEVKDKLFMKIPFVDEKKEEPKQKTSFEEDFKNLIK